MKRVKAACVMQTLHFSQKEDAGFTKSRELELNHEEVEHYKSTLERARTKYKITKVQENPDNSITVHVIKQYNKTTDSSEYFN